MAKAKEKAKTRAHVQALCDLGNRDRDLVALNQAVQRKDEIITEFNNKLNEAQNVINARNDEIVKLKKEVESEKSLRSMYSGNAAAIQKEIDELHRTFDLLPGILPQTEKDEKESWRDVKYSLGQRFISYLIKLKTQ